MTDSTNGPSLARIQLASFIAVAIFGVALAIAARIGQLVSADALAKSDIAHRLLTLHAHLLMFAGLLPGIPAAFGHFLLPKLLRKESKSDRRFGWFSLYLYWCGVALLIGAVLIGRLDDGLYYYLAYRGQATMPLIALSFGILLLGLSSAVNAIRLFAATQKMRAHIGARHSENSTLVRLMSFAGVVQIVTVPILACTFLMFLLDRLNIYVAFDPVRGGDAMLLPDLFWFHVCSGTTASILPVVGIVSHNLEVENPSLKESHSTTIHMGLAVTILAFLGWGNHLVTRGQSSLMSAIFSATALLMVVPMSVIFATVARSVRRVGLKSSLAAQYGAATLLVLALGFVSGIPLALLGVNQYLEGSLYYTGHLHLLGLGVLLFGALAGWQLIQPAHASTGPLAYRSVTLASLALAMALIMLSAAELFLGCRGVSRLSLGTESSFHKVNWLIDLGILLAAIAVSFAAFHWLGRQPQLKRASTDLS